MDENVLNKLKILAESAKYDVSCSSSGTVRSGKAGMLGNTVGGWGICHSFAEDGRCISLLKVMLTNYCIYDCAYCINRRSNDIPRAAFTPGEGDYAPAGGAGFSLQGFAMEVSSYPVVDGQPLRLGSDAGRGRAPRRCRSIRAPAPPLAGKAPCRSSTVRRVRSGDPWSCRGNGRTGP